MNKDIIRNCALGYSCDQNWNKLDSTDLFGVKFCNSCQREVHWCDDDVEIMQNITLNRSIGFASSLSTSTGNNREKATPQTNSQKSLQQQAPKLSEPDIDFDDDIPF